MEKYVLGQDDFYAKFAAKFSVLFTHIFTTKVLKQYSFCGYRL